MAQVVSDLCGFCVGEFEVLNWSKKCQSGKLNTKVPDDVDSAPIHDKAESGILLACCGAGSNQAKRAMTMSIIVLNHSTVIL